MKNNYIVATLLLLFIATAMQAQVFKGELIGGMNLSQVDGDEIYGFKKPGLNLGVGVELPISKNFFLSTEVLFTQKGAKQRAKMDTILIVDNEDSIRFNGAYNLRLNYMEVPLIFSFKHEDAFTIGVGASYARRVGVKEIEQDIYNKSAIADSAYSPNDFCLLAETRVRLYENLWFNLRYSYSMSSIRERTYTAYTSGEKFTQQQYNNVLSFRFIWVIGKRNKSILEQVQDAGSY